MLFTSLHWQRYQHDANDALIPRTPFYVILNTAISWWTAPPSPTITPAAYHYIDSVTAYMNVTEMRR